MRTTNAIETLHLEMEWLQRVINQVISSYLLNEGHENNWQDIPMPNLQNRGDTYTQSIKEWELNIYERLGLALAISPHFKPEVLDIFFGQNKVYNRGFTEFGGVIDKNHSGFLPTGQTLLFLITATNPELRYEVMDVLSNNSTLIREQVISLSNVEDYLPKYNGVLKFSDRWFNYFIGGEMLEIEQNSQFSANRITTNLEWNDIVLDAAGMNQLQEIQSWLSHGNTIMNEWGLNRMIKPGYRSLFHGASGTGKTLAAALLAKSSGREIYKVDLSIIVSKYIGETEKNLAKIFDIAEHKDWILFFDEADALFGKRTSVKSSNDRHANQQISYLLQRIESYPGVVILSSNLKANLDEAFTRRFQSMIHFNIPGPEGRYQIWQNAFSGVCKLSPDIDLRKVSEEFEITGGTIMNVLRYCALSAVQRDSKEVTQKELLEGIKKEFKKENKTIADL